MDPVSAIVAEGRRRGYSDADIAWIVADAIGESSLNPNARIRGTLGYSSKTRATLAATL
jgi:hypothetical protein